MGMNVDTVNKINHEKTSDKLRLRATIQNNQSLFIRTVNVKIHKEKVKSCYR